jgi:2,3-bisphosphoglycerate-independent phosphoglycerate mutase
MTKKCRTWPSPIPGVPEKHLGDVVSRLGKRQLRIAETEKYAHVTFFFNCGVERTYKGEDRMLILSPKQYPTYDLIPQMSAYEVAREACKSIHSGNMM